MNGAGGPRGAARFFLIIRIARQRRHFSFPAAGFPIRRRMEGRLTLEGISFIIMGLSME